jgi:DNA-binding beta-propeller fold protein YncE
VSLKKRLILLACLMVFGLRNAKAETSHPLRLVQSISLPNVVGRLDHLAIDLKNQRLFVAALGNHSLEVVDLKRGVRIQSITGLQEPQGVLFIPEQNEIVVSDGERGTLEIFDGSTFKRIRSMALGGGDADNLRYDPSRRWVYVGYGEGALGVVDMQSGQSVGRIPLEGHPESFQLEKSGTKIFVNIPQARQITVIDQVQRRILTVWQTIQAHANFPMALDETDHRLFVGFRDPARLIIFDSKTGKNVATLEIAKDVDDIFYDEVRKHFYLSCGEGFLQVIDRLDSDHYRLLSSDPTSPGARTSLFVPERNQLFLAVPSRGSQMARIDIYDIQP